MVHSWRFASERPIHRPFLVPISSTVSSLVTLVLLAGISSEQ